MYTTGRTGLGQLVRFLRLGSSILDAGIARKNFMIITGSPFSKHLFPKPACTVTTLPEAAKLTIWGGADSLPHGAALELSGLLSKRILRIIRHIKPDLFLTSHHAGIRGELLPLYPYFNRLGIKVILCWRDIFESPANINIDTKLLNELVEKHIYRVLVFGNKETDKYLPLNRLSNIARNKVSHLGYVAPKYPRQPSIRHTKVTKMLCQVGGGYDGFRVAKLVAKAFALLRKREGQRFLHLDILCGPLMPNPERTSIKHSLTADNVSVYDWFHLTPTKLLSYDLLICMGGYNSCVEAAKSGTPTIIIPRRESHDKEQLIRGRLFNSKFRNILLFEHAGNQLATSLLATLLKNFTFTVAERNAPSVSASFFLNPTRLNKLLFLD